MSFSIAPQFIFSIGLYLLAGYMFGRVSYYRRFTLEHLTTQQHSFSILGYAFFLYVISWLLYWAFVNPDMPAWLAAVERQTEISCRAVIALGLGLALGVAENFGVLMVMSDDPALILKPAKYESTNIAARMRMAATSRYVDRSDDEALKMLFRATLLKKKLMVTLSGGKVYVGAVTRYPSNPTRQPTSIRIVPYRSGYRDETKKLHLPIKYDELWKKIEFTDAGSGSGANDGFSWLWAKKPDREHPLFEDIASLRISNTESVNIDANDFSIVVPWSEICSMSIYDENVYDAFNSAN